MVKEQSVKDLNSLMPQEEDSLVEVAATKTNSRCPRPRHKCRDKVEEVPKEAEEELPRATQQEILSLRTSKLPQRMNLKTSR